MKYRDMGKKSVHLTPRLPYNVQGNLWMKENKLPSKT